MWAIYCQRASGKKRKGRPLLCKNQTGKNANNSLRGALRTMSGRVRRGRIQDPRIPERVDFSASDWAWLWLPSPGFFFIIIPFFFSSSLWGRLVAHVYCCCRACCIEYASGDCCCCYWHRLVRARLQSRKFHYYYYYFFNDLSGKCKWNEWNGHLERKLAEVYWPDCKCPLCSIFLDGLTMKMGEALGRISLKQIFIH